VRRRPAPEADHLASGFTWARDEVAQLPPPCNICFLDHVIKIYQDKIHILQFKIRVLEPEAWSGGEYD